jgi:hypothetical protein
MSSIFPFEEPMPGNVYIPDELIDINSIKKSQELPDGSSIFEVIKEGSEPKRKRRSDDDFYANIADDLEEGTLAGLATRLLDEIKEDKASRTEWEKTTSLAMRYLGFKVEEFRNVPFFQACAAYDSTLASALLHFYSTARAELFPAMGPCRSEIFGVPTTEIEDQGDRVKMFMNYFLTNLDREYYPDSERLLMYVGLFGCAFRKVYQDPILNRPCARLIRPQDFIINHHTATILTSDRMAEVMYLSRKEVLLRQRSGNFIKYDLPGTSDDNKDEETPIQKTIKKIDGVNADSSENKSLFKFYEVHVNLDVEDIQPKGKKKKGEIPKPYVVTICDATRKVVSIKRNWKEGDDKYERREYFVHYYYLPGYGIYSIGLAHLLGSNAITLTQILRQQLDAATLKNFPGGLKTKGIKSENNDRSIGPAEFHEVETMGRPISDCIMLMPYGEPSQVLSALRQELKQETQTLASMAENQVPEAGTNTPVGTTLAMLEVATKLQSSVLRSLHTSLGYELQLLFNLFGEYLEEEPYPFAVPGKETAIMKKDFNDRVNIVPVSNPNVLTSTHRLLKAESQLKLAQSAPELHDMREAYYSVYQAMNIENIDKLLPKKEEALPLDPITENMNVLLGKSLAVAVFQDDESHNIVHRKFVQDNQANPQAVATMMLHIQKHEANKLLKQMQVVDPNMPMILDEKVMLEPQIQNMLAQQDAQRTMQEMQQQQEQQMQMMANQVDPNKVMMADIEQRREASYLKDEEAKLKAETEAFKAQLKFEGDQAKTEAEREMADDKNKVDLTIAGIKQPKPNILE